MNSNLSHVIKPIFGQVLGLFVVGAGPLLADSAATVTAAVNQVTHGSSETAASTPATVGTHLKDGEYLKTGVKSRAELQLANQSVTRLGANTIFNYSSTNNEIDLQAGTVLFSKPKDGAQMNIKTAAVTAAVVGTTGFIQVHGHNFIFGLVEGHSTLTVGGKAFDVGSGEFLQFNPGTVPQIHSFNVPTFLKTAPLITSFKGTLPNQLYIDKEVAEYNNLASRGFVGPNTGGITFVDLPGLVPHLPVTTDSARNAQSQFVNPPQPPPPPPQPPSNPFGGDPP
jgi:mannose-6-phosphate isomerase-like protein (cupin superfamily)